MTDNISLKEYFEARFDALAKAVEIALNAAHEKDRTHNDILGAMKEQQNHFVTKESVKWAFGSLIAGIAVAVSIFAAINA